MAVIRNYSTNLSERLHIEFKESLPNFIAPDMGHRQTDRQKGGRT
jgi:hypothetical protein